MQSFFIDVPSAPSSDLPPSTSLFCDFAELYRYHASDWFGLTATFYSRTSFATVINTALYMFSFSFLTSATFGSQFAAETDGTFTVEHTFLSGGLVGLIMACVSGQPLVLCGNTGPIVLLYVYLYEFAHNQSVAFQPLVAWTAIWSFVMHAVISLCGLNRSKYLVYVTRFTGEIFEILIAADYITQAVLGFSNQYRTIACPNSSTPPCSSTTSQFLNGTFQLLIGLAFFGTALFLQKCNRGGMRWGTSFLRLKLGQFGCLIALVLATLLSYVPTWASHPTSFSGGFYEIPIRVDVAGSSWGTPQIDLTSATSGLFKLPTQYVFSSIIPALLLTILFYVDQNLSTLRAIEHVGGFKTPRNTFDMDFFLLGVTVLITGLLGLPPSSGLIPQNPMHSLSLISNQNSEGEPRVIEQRISAIIHSVLLLLTILVLPLVGFIPLGVLWGSFLLLSSEAYDAQFLQRCLLFFTSKKSRKLKPWDDFREILKVPAHIVNLYTLVQFALWAVIFAVAVIIKIPYPMNAGNNWVIVGSLFPLFIALCAVFRFTLFKRIIAVEFLEILDPAPDTHEDRQQRRLKSELAAAAQAADDQVAAKEERGSGETNSSGSR